MQFAKGAGQAVLNEIVRRDEIARQGARVAAQAGDFSFDVPIRVRHRRLLPMATIGRRADPSAAESIDLMLSDDVMAGGFL